MGYSTDIYRYIRLKYRYILGLARDLSENGGGPFAEGRKIQQWIWLNERVYVATYVRQKRTSDIWQIYQALNYLSEQMVDMLLTNLLLRDSIKTGTDTIR